MLNDTLIKNLKPAEKPKKYADGGGLFLYISASGKKLWRMAYRFNKKSKLLSFGEYPTVSLKFARERREEAKKLLAENIDPSRDKREKKFAALEAESNSFESIVLEWHETQTVHNSDKDRARKLYILKKHLLAPIGKKPISLIDARDILAVIKPLEQKNELHNAHKVLQYSGMVFRYAVATGRITRNIAADLRGAIRPIQTTHRATITDPEKIGALLCKLEGYHGHFQVRCALRLMPLLFVRSAELACAEWSEINFETCEWRIPAHRMKMPTTHIVPLAEQAVHILKELHQYTGNGTYLFPSRNSVKKPIHFSTLLQAIRTLGYCKEEMCVHGFRAMASTLLNEFGYNRDWIERQLAHAERSGVRAAYNYAEYLPERRKMMQEWANYLQCLRDRAYTVIENA